MEVKLNEIVKYCDGYLNNNKFLDYCSNGLQIEGKENVTKVALGVSACAELFDKAIERNADLILVHHGIFWGDNCSLVGVLGDRVRKLMKNDVSLMAYHLPLDAHPVVGNNAVMAELLRLQDRRSFCEYKGNNIGIRGKINPEKFDFFREKVEKSLGPIKAFVNGFQGDVQKVGIVSGGASKDVEGAFLEGLDTYITGEIGEPTKAFCEEAGINYISLGHYNSERWGVKALGDHMNDIFGLEVEFIDTHNPY